LRPNDIPIQRRFAAIADTVGSNNVYLPAGVFDAGVDFRRIATMSDNDVVSYQNQQTYAQTAPEQYTQHSILHSMPPLPKDFFVEAALNTACLSGRG
jgi:hypothetical protein